MNDRHFVWKYAVVRVSFSQKILGKIPSGKLAYLQLVLVDVWCYSGKPKFVKCFGVYAIRWLLFGFIIDLDINFKNTQIDTQIGLSFRYPMFSSDPHYISMIYWKRNLSFLYYSGIIILFLRSWSICNCWNVPLVLMQVSVCDSDMV